MTSLESSAPTVASHNHQTAGTGRRKRVLLLTNAEHGQANVFLAVGDALLHANENPEVHFASFDPIRSAVEAATELARRTCPPGREILFHALGGMSMKPAWDRPEVIGGEGHKSLEGWKLLLRVMLPWTGPEFLEVFNSVVDVVARVQPDAIAIDPCLAPALTACHHLGVSFVVLSPNTIKDFAMPSQPNLASLWKYPCVGSGIPYPIPVLLFPINFLLLAYFVFMSRDNSHENEVSSYMKQSKDSEIQILTLRRLAMDNNLGIKILVANLPEIEYPFAVIPEHIVPCGPMIGPAKPLLETDPNLCRWLDRGPTIYINLGTHNVTTEDAAVEMAAALKGVLDEARSWSGHALSELQVLWKLVPDPSEPGDYDLGIRAPGSRIRDVLGRYIDMDLVRITRWVTAEPSTILEHESVVLSIHHGGANSFLEAVRQVSPNQLRSFIFSFWCFDHAPAFANNGVSAGKPHVVLPCWMDTFDFANRAELAGIGLWGNRNNRPGWTADELGPVLREILLGPNASAIRERAQTMADVCQSQAGGRYKAARIIMGEFETD